MKSAIDQNMVLSFGMPRSGTTWVGKLLDSHIDTYYLHEPDTVFPRNDLPLLTKDDDTGKIGVETAEWLNQILVLQHQKITAFPPIFPKSYMSLQQRALLRVSTLVSRIDGKLGAPMGVTPIRRVDNSRDYLLVWKSIESLGRIGLFMSLCKNAKAIHLLRHPCGHINSTLQGFEGKKFSTDAPIYEDWDLFDKLIAQSRTATFDLQDIKSMAPEERLAFRWGILNDHCFQALEGKPHMQLRYEDVCENPLQEIGKVFKWLGLEVGEQTVKFARLSTSSNRDSYYGTTKDPLKSAYSWKEKLSVSQKERIMGVVSSFQSGGCYQEMTLE